MTYQLRVPSDGGKESSQEGNKKADTGPPVSYIREFTIRPSSGTIPPDLSQDIQVHTIIQWYNFDKLSVKFYLRTVEVFTMNFTKINNLILI